MLHQPDYFVIRSTPQYYHLPNSEPYISVQSVPPFRVSYQRSLDNATEVAKVVAYQRCARGDCLTIVPGSGMPFSSGYRFVRCVGETRYTIGEKASTTHHEDVRSAGVI